MRLIVAYRGIPHNRGWAIGDSLSRALESLGHEVWRYGNYYQTCEDLQDAPFWGYHADALIYCECNDTDSQHIPLLERVKCPKVYWEFDTSMHAEFSAGFHSYFNAVFLANPTLLTKFPRSQYLPIGFDPLLLQPKMRLKKHAAGIVGTPFPARVEFAKWLGIPVFTGAYGEDYVNALDSICVNVHHHDSGGDGLLVSRIWEVTGLGGCLLTQDSPSLRLHFVDDVHCHTYKSLEDAKELLEWLVSDATARARTGEAARKEVLAKHTYQDRAQAILNTLKAL